MSQMVPSAFRISVTSDAAAISVAADAASSVPREVPGEKNVLTADPISKLTSLPGLRSLLLFVFCARSLLPAKGSGLNKG